MSSSQHLLGNIEFEEEEQTNIETSNDDLKTSDQLQPSKSTSNTQTAWNILNLTQGIGVLGIPYAISVGGLLTIPHIVFIGVITHYTSTLIIDLLYDEDEEEDSGIKFRKKVRFEFAQIGHDSFKKQGWRIVSTIQVLHLFGASILYLLLVHKAVELFYLSYFQSRTLCILATGLLITPTALVSNMSHLSWLSFTSLCLIDIVLLTFSIESVASYKTWNFDLPLYDGAGLTVANSIILFSFVAHPYLPKIENGMKKPEDFNSVSMISFSIATLIKITFGVLAVLNYGDNIKQTLSDNIQNSKIRLYVTCLLGLNGYFSFAMPTSIIIKIMKSSENKLFQKLFPSILTNQKMAWQETFIDVILRFFLILLVTLVAVLVPVFSTLMAIFGSLTAVLIILFIPLYGHIVLNKKKWTLLNALLIVYGIVSVIVGLTTSTIKLINIIKNDDT